MRRTFKVSIAFLLMLTSLQAQSTKRSITLDDVAKIRNVGDPQVSPDGKWVAYTLGTVDTEKDKRDTDIWMVSWDGLEQIRLTSTADSSESSPRWSPDNKYLAFLTTRGDESQKKQGAQVWLLNRSGGEGQQLTNIKGGVTDFAWSPDDKRLALVAKDADPDDEPEKKDGWKRKTAPPIVIDRYHFKQDRDGYLRALHSHLWLFDLDTRTAEALTSGRFDEQAPAWSPDGRSIAFVSNRTSDPDRNNDSNIYVIEAKAGAQPRQLTTYKGNDGGQPSWSPDGKWIAYLQGDETKYSAYSMNTLAIVPAVEEGQPRILTPSLDRPLGGKVVWTSDSHQLMFVVTDDRIAYVGRVPVAGGPVEKLTDGLRVVSSLSRRDDGSMALLSTTAMEPDEVYAVENSSMRPLTHQNDQLFASLQLGTTENFTSKSKDNTEVHGIMTDYTIATDSRFKAAFSGAGSALQTSMYGLDQYTHQYDNEMGPPWKAQELWMKISYPFFHADRIKTPTLFLGGEKDANVPVAGGEQMYQALRSLGIDTQLVIYPGQYHSLTTPSYQRDRLERYVEWLNKYLK